MAVLAVTARVGRPLAGLDRIVLDAVLAHRTAAGVDLARLVTDTGTSPVLLSVIAAAGIAVRLRTGSWRPGITALVVAGLGVLARFLLSLLAREPRPAEDFRAVPRAAVPAPPPHDLRRPVVEGC